MRTSGSRQGRSRDMALNLPVERGHITDALIHAIGEGRHGLGVVPGLLRQALKRRAWKESIVQCTGEHFAGFADFQTYVASPPPEGLGASIAVIKNIIRNDPEAEELLEQELVGKHGGDRRSRNFKHDNIRLD